MLTPTRVDPAGGRESKTGPIKLDPKLRERLLSAVSFDLPSRRLFPASWCDVGVTINRAGLSAADIVYTVRRPDDPKDHTCLLSVARGSAAGAAFRLLVGARPGTYALSALRQSNGEILGRVSFRIDPTATFGEHGPSCWVRPTDGPPGVAIGGGPTGVQNVGAISNLRDVTWNIAVVMLDYDDAAFPATDPARQAAIDRWSGMMATGFTPGSGDLSGETISVKAFIEECSFGRTKIASEVFGPIKVPGKYLDYFNLQDDQYKGIFWQPGQDGYVAGAPQYQSTHPKDWQALVSAVNEQVDLLPFNSVFFVSPNHVPSGQTATRFPWPQATLGTPKLKVTETDKATGIKTAKDHDLGCFVMPDDFSMIRETTTTICHELGHNFGMDDQYSPAVQAEKFDTYRNLGNWEPMAWETLLPHHSLYHKLALGWALDPAVTDEAARDKIVRSIDFGKAGAGSETIKIAPIEAACPAQYRHGVEIRIADGHNYYFEYRRASAGIIADQHLPEDGVVLGIDAQKSPDPLAARPQLLQLAFDPDGDSFALSAGEDFEQTKLKAGDVPMSLRVEVLSTEATHAEVRVSYQVDGGPNPRLRPWNTMPDRWWQSPDIEVRNARTEAEPATYANKLWLGNENIVVAKVTNTGAADAPGVQVRFAVKDYTVAGGAEKEIGWDTNDVPAGATVEFKTRFTPPGGAVEDAHYCIVARITPYQTPTSKTMELDPYDNIAQSNYAGLTSVMASPPTRPAMRVQAANPFDKATRVYVEPAQSHGGFISYLDHRWLALPAKGSGVVRVSSEYAAQPAAAMQRSDHWEMPAISPGRRLGFRARLALSSWALSPADQHPRRLQGADIDLQAAFRTVLTRVVADDGRGVSGLVVASSEDGIPVKVTTGTVLLMLDPDGRGRRTLSTKVGSAGDFRFVDRGFKPGLPFRLHYLPTLGLAAATSVGVME